MIEFEIPGGTEKSEAMKHFDDLIKQSYLDQLRMQLAEQRVKLSEKQMEKGQDETIDVPFEALEVQVKDSNPKDAVGIKKAPLSTVSGPVMMEVGVAMMEGALKYGRHNYREIGVRASVYYDALMRHIVTWWEGEDIDEESGLSHITKATACMMVLRDAQIRGKMVDDRPPGTKGFVAHLNKAAAALVEKYPSPKDAFTADGREPEEYQP